MNARFSWLTAIVVLMTAVVARAEVKVELTDMHICCGACVKGIEKAVGDVASAKVAVNKDNEACTITAPDAATAKKVVAALATAGFHAECKDKAYVMADDSGAPTGNVKKLTVTGAHNCCGSCAKAILAAVGEVKGAKAPELKGKQTSFVVEGDFSAAKLIEELNEHGFHVKVTQ